MNWKLINSPINQSSRYAYHLITIIIITAAKPFIPDFLPWSGTYDNNCLCLLCLAAPKSVTLPRRWNWFIVNWTFFFLTFTSCTDGGGETDSSSFECSLEGKSLRGLSSSWVVVSQFVEWFLDILELDYGTSHVGWSVDHSIYIHFVNFVILMSSDLWRGKFITFKFASRYSVHLWH